MFVTQSGPLEEPGLNGERMRVLTRLGSPHNEQRLESVRDAERVEVSAADLALVLEGIDVTGVKRHKRFRRYGLCV